MANRSPWTPDWVVAPGEILLESLEERGLSQAELARRMDRPVKTINEIVKGKAAITAATAIQLERALGIDASMWVGLESKYRQSLARAEDLASLGEEKSFLKRFPMKDLIARGLVDKEASDAERVGQLLSFFGVSSPNAWRRQWTAAPALRGSPSFASSMEPLSAWIRLGQLIADRSEVGQFDHDAFRELLESIRAWTRQAPFETVWSKVVRRCAEVGVALVALPEFSGTHISGAAHQTDRGIRVIQLSGRFKRDDQLWFSFFHEAGHVLLTPGRLVIDAVASTPDLDGDEALVDAFARDFLLSGEVIREFVTSHPQPVESDIRGLAKSEGVAVGIVVGRLQHDGVIEPSQFNYLKKPVNVE